MSNSGLDYLLTYALGDNSKLSLYYDFSTGSAGITTGALPGGYAITGIVRNIYPGKNVGLHNILIENITGNTLFDTTGEVYTNLTGNFLSGGDSGYLSLSNGKITGLNAFPYNDCTFLFSASKTEYDDGLIFGSLKKGVGLTYTEASGYNIGINTRNQLFFNGLGEKGEYVITANEIELAEKNICSVSVGLDSINFARYDLGSNTIEEQSYNIQTNFINNASNQIGYIGGGDDIDYIKGPNNFSGWLDNLAIFSGVIETDFCLPIASGFVSNLEESQDFAAGSVVTGYDTTLLYTTGFTGVSIEITGSYADKRSGVLKNFGFDTVTSNTNEGTIIGTGTQLNNGFLDNVLEREGLVLNDYIYTVTGDSAEATLGLEHNISFSVTSGQHNISFTSPLTTGIIQVYASGITGIILDEPTGSISTPIYNNSSITGTKEFSLVLDTGRFKEYKYDKIYYLDNR